MSYLVLARKYRPTSFAEVVGQEVVTRVLEGAIREERVGHAYLFTGPRGTGKTTSARLFAKALNCERGPTPEPCGECERCHALDAGSEVDVVEIDAASHTGVDNIRDLREQAGYVPMRARFKIYIVDEVHMLSKAAFNALLKTLEEPPPHVKFLFATTDPHKIPDTIQSRCQILKLAPLSEPTIQARLDEVFGREGVVAEDGVSAELARRARGGMRDALSLADQLLALVGSRPTLADCERLASEDSVARVEALVEHLIEGERAAALAGLPPEGDDAQLLGALLEHLRACLLAALCGSDAPMLPAGAGGTAAGATLAERGKRIGARRLELWLQELLAARERMRLLPAHARLTLEVTLLDLCRTEATLGLAEIAERLAALEERLATGGHEAPRADATPGTSSRTGARAAPPNDARSGSLQPAPRRPPAPAAPASTGERPAGGASGGAASGRGGARRASSTAPGGARPRVTTNSTADAWEGFLAELAEDSPGLAKLLRARGRLVSLAEDRARVQLTGLADPERLMVEDKRNRKACERAFASALGRELQLDLGDATDARPGKEDPFTREVADLFEGRIED